MDLAPTPANNQQVAQPKRFVFTKVVLSVFVTTKAVGLRLCPHGRGGISSSCRSPCGLRPLLGSGHFWAQATFGLRPPARNLQQVGFGLVVQAPSLTPRVLDPAWVRPGFRPRLARVLGDGGVPPPLPSLPPWFPLWVGSRPGGMEGGDLHSKGMRSEFILGSGHSPWSLIIYIKVAGSTLVRAKVANSAFDCTNIASSTFDDTLREATAVDPSRGKVPSRGHSGGPRSRRLLIPWRHQAPRPSA